MDYNRLLIKQYGRKVTDGYPNILGKKMSRSKMEDETTWVKDDAPTHDVYVEQSDEPENDGPMTVDELAQHYQDGLTTLQQVIGMMPNSQAKNNATIFLETSVLWAQQVFAIARGQEQQAKSLRKKR